MRSDRSQESELSLALLGTSAGDTEKDVIVNVREQGQCCRLCILILSVSLAALTCVWLVSVVISQWKQQTSYRTWLVLGLMSYLSVLVYKGWDLLLQFGEETLLHTASHD